MAFERIQAIVDNFNLKEETLFMAYQLYDRFCFGNNLSSEQLRLLPTTVVHMSAKYEEIYAPPMTKYVRYLPAGESVHTITNLEAEILHRLQFELCQPNCLTFYQMMCDVLQVPALLQEQGMMLLECSLMSSLSLRHKPSAMAMSVLYWACTRTHNKLVARNIIERMGEWGVEHHQLCEFIQDVEAQLEEACALSYLAKKYASLLEPEL